MSHVPGAQPRGADPAAPAAPRAAAARADGRSLRRLDSGAVHDEPEQSGPPPAVTDEERAAEEHEEGFVRRWQPRLYLRILVLGLLVAYAIAFVLENNKQTHVHFVLGTARASLIWVVLLSVGLGIVLGVLLSQLYRRRRRRH